MKAKETSASSPVLRCDLLDHAMNPGKERKILALLRAWRGTAGTIAAIQWRMYQEFGRFDAHADAATACRKSLAVPRLRIVKALVEQFDVSHVNLVKARKKYKHNPPPLPNDFTDPLSKSKAVIGAAPVQMATKQVVGTLKSYVANCQNNFRDIVRDSRLDEVHKHMLFTVNLAQAWGRFEREIRITHEIEGVDTVLIVPPEMRRLARAIWRQVLSQHNKPSMRRIGMVIDQRKAKLLPTVTGSTFPLWLKLGTLEKPIQIPLKSYPYFDERKGQRKLTIQVNQDRVTKRLFFGVITDISEVCEDSKAEYAKTVKTKELSLDFGLSTLFGSDLGDLFGGGFLTKLKARDATVTGIARHWQRANPGRKLRECERYTEQQARIQGFIKTEVRRALNAMIRARRPGALILEQLSFRSPEMSRRMNRLVQRCGRSVVAAKLISLEQELGIMSTLVPAAYTSLTCSCCGYVDKRNRPSQSRFACLWCGLELHADVNAARNIGGRRSHPTIGSGWVSKAQILDVLVQRHVERWSSARCAYPLGLTGSLRRPADPRLTNPYFKAWRDGVRSLPTGSCPEENRIAA